MKAYFFAIALLLPAISFAQDRSIRPQAKAAPTINIEDSEVFKSDNGITIILSENHKLPRVSFNAVMGSTPEAEGSLAGLSEITGSLILSGTDKRTKDELDNEKDYIGASLSADHNSVYMSCLTKHLETGLSLMSDALMNANFPQEEVDRIIKQNESALISAKSDAGTMAANARSVANFPKGHPYGEVMTEETLANINRDAIVEYYKKTFTPEGSYLVVVGDITKEEVKAIVEKYFASWQGPASNKVELGSGQFNKGNRVIFVKKPGAVQSVISVTFPMNVKPGDPDYLKLTVLNEILGGGVFGSRLMQNLREDKAYTYGCRSSVRITENGSYFAAGGNFRNEVTDSAITEILYEIEQITDDYVKDAELNLTKSSMAGGFARSLERPSTVARFALNIIKNDLPKDYYQTYLKQLEAITKDDLLMVAQKYFTPKNCNIIVVGNEEVIDRLKQFDADGEIEKLDAFGRAIKETIPADITADQLIENHVLAMTQMPNMKKAKKALKKIKTMKQTMEMTMAQMPFPMKSTRIWTAAGVQAEKMEAQGMKIQSSYFDGNAGYTSNMQTGKKELTEEEISAKKKTAGLIPELNYAETGMEYEIIGIEMKNGVECYVMKTNDGESESYDYYSKEDFKKVAVLTISQTEEGTQEVSTTISNYTESNGILFPSEMNISVGQAAFDVKVTSIELNAKIDTALYK